MDKETKCEATGDTFEDNNESYIFKTIEELNQFLFNRYKEV